MRKLGGKVAVVTGAASGIGRALAIELGQRGCHLALSDVNEEGLAETAEGISSQVRVTTAQLDVSDRARVHAHADQVMSDHDQVHLVINNAGVGMAAPVSVQSYEDLEWMMNINFWGVVHGTKAFLPLLERSEWGHIVNISSVFGIVAVPTQSAYNAAKFAVRGFTESLRQELDDSDSQVSVTCVHPGGIKTNIARVARYRGMDGLGAERAGDDFERLARTTPKQAAKAILDGVEKNRRRVLIGADARVIDALQRLLPTGYQPIVTRFARSRLK